MRRVGRNREKNKRMPVGWHPSRAGVIYFRPTNAADREIVKTITGGPLSIRLGPATEAPDNPLWLKVVAARRGLSNFTVGTVGEICALARRELLPSIENEKTKEERSRHIDELDALFGSKRYARNVYEASRDTAGIYLRAMDVQRHILAFRGKPGHVSVNRRVRSWELAFDWARAPGGLTEYNPCSGLQMNPERPRDVLPADADIFTLYRWLDPPARFMVALNRYYGRRKVEALGLMLTSEQDDGLHLWRGKNRKEIVLLWDRRLRRMWHRLLQWRTEVARAGKVATLAALLNRKGGAYTESGFNSARRRAMKRAGMEGRFTFHDIRATRASTLPAAKAVEVLAHEDGGRTTHRVYRRGAHVVDLTAEGNLRKPSKNLRKPEAGG